MEFSKSHLVEFIEAFYQRLISTVDDPIGLLNSNPWVVDNVPVLCG